MGWATNCTPAGYTVMTYTATASTATTIYWSRATCSDSSDYTSSWCESPSGYRRRVRGLQQRCEKEQVDPVLAPAYRKAKEWLLEYLSTEQRRSLDAEKFFEVVGNKSGKHYRIRAGLSGVHNIDQMNGVEIERTLCFLPDGDLPECDILLTQKAILETDERYALSMANTVPRVA